MVRLRAVGAAHATLVAGLAFAWMACDSGSSDAIRTFDASEADRGPMMFDKDVGSDVRGDRDAGEDTPPNDHDAGDESPPVSEDAGARCESEAPVAPEGVDAEEIIRAASDLGSPGAEILGANRWECQSEQIGRAHV